MNRDDIIRMARDAGSIDSDEVIETLFMAFAAAEREECAKVCEALGPVLCESYGDGAECIASSEACAAAIRAKGKA